MAKTKFKGGCFCGAVRYEMLDKPMIVHCCHCTECQNQTGSAFAINAIIEINRLRKLKGRLERVVMSPKNDSPHDIYRCRKCKVAVWSDYGRRPWRVFVRVGTLDRPKSLKPDVHIFVRSKQPWVKLPKNVPAFPLFYKLEDVWTEASLRRRELALKN